MQRRAVSLQQLWISHSTVQVTSYKLKNFGSAPTTKRTQVHYKLSQVK